MSKAMAALRDQARALFARRMELVQARASRGIGHPDSAAYLAVAHAAVQFLDAIDAARTYQTPEADLHVQLAEERFRAALGWPKAEYVEGMA